MSKQVAIIVEVEQDMSKNCDGCCFEDGYNCTMPAELGDCSSGIFKIEVVRDE